jgi:Ca2+/Na+ antiporter
MKTLKVIIVYLLLAVIMAPCLCIFNEQPDTEPQRWYINAIGLVYCYILYRFLSIVYKSKKTTGHEQDGNKRNPFIIYSGIFS